MAVFKYEIRIKHEKEQGILTAFDRNEARQKLQDRGAAILKLTTVSSSVSESPEFNLRSRGEMEKRAAGFLTGSAAVEQAMKQIASMLSGGVPIISTLQTVAAQSPYYLRRALFTISNKVQEGHSFGEALCEEMAFLGNVVTGLIAAGEANGDIDKMCQYSANLLASRRELKGNLIQAMIYPAVVILLTVAIVCFLMWKIIPKIMKFLKGRSAGLPYLTQKLVDITNFLEEYGLYIAAAPIVITIAIWLLRRNEQTGRVVDQYALHIPLLGKAFRAAANTLWCRTLGLLLKSGINIISALEFTEQSVANKFYRQELVRIRDLVTRGHPLSTGLRVSDICRYIPAADSMISVGEQTGKVDEGLLQVASFSEDDLQRRIGLLAKLIEPALFVIVGSIVGFVYIAFFMGLMAASTGRGG
ncbi:type II secretion system F family protein [Lentisphaerota bacterium ZTH]|nr:type II secretion system F family protein [Lentisphaerota bacterium]WET05540.1 type II secretion system F family protein [Lentisphaerota bacterium ZTH]